MQKLVARITDPKEREKGFTLIELLVVIIIIGILAAIAIPIFLNQKKKATDATVKSDVRNATSAIETYTTDDPSSATQWTAADVAAMDIKVSAGNLIEVAGSPAAGYCIWGANPDATSATGKSGPGQGAASAGYWYDSQLGGLQPAVDISWPAGGACAAILGGLGGASAFHPAT